MRILQGEEIAVADRYIAEAVKEGVKSPCEKSKRGVVISKEGDIIGRGYNQPPLEMKCEPSYCREICNKYCEHAEKMAVLDARKSGKDPSGSRMYHIKVEKGLAVVSGGPSCVDCSKYIAFAGITEFVLKQKEGYTLYGIEEFHRLSLDSLKESPLEHALKVGGTDFD